MDPDLPSLQNKPAFFVRSVEKHEYNAWTIATVSNHILPSLCTQNCAENDADRCNYCKYRNELTELPHFPEMIFGENSLVVTHQRGFGIEFNALDALRMVNTKDGILQVAGAEEWKESRSDVQGSVVKPYDWTYATAYKGTLIGDSTLLLLEETEERINMEKLKRREKILFYQDVSLYEDELHDHGCAVCSVKIRVMASGFFILLRYYLRVDNVKVQMNDTRFYYEEGKNYLLREYTRRASSIKELNNISIAVLTDPNELWPRLPLLESKYEKLVFPL